MLRALLPRGAALAAATAVSISGSSQEKLPIYPAPEPTVVLVPAPTELEKSIRAARITATSTFEDSHRYVQGWVSKWIGVEHAVENRIKSLYVPDEPLTPNILYVGVATLTGSIIARNRFIGLRFLLPPTFLIFSMQQLLPKTSANISEYFSSLEDTYAPRLAQAHYTANAHTLMTIDMAKDSFQRGRVQLDNAVKIAVDKTQEFTGLKLREALGWGEDAVHTAQARGKELSKVVEAKASELKEAATKEAKKVEHYAQEKKEEIKRLV